MTDSEPQTDTSGLTVGLPPLNSEAVLWVAALDLLPIEERVTWVKETLARIEQLNAARTRTANTVDPHMVGPKHDWDARSAAADARCLSLEEALRHYADENHWSVDKEMAGESAVYTTFGYDGGHALPWHVAREALASPTTEETA